MDFRKSLVLLLEKKEKRGDYSSALQYPSILNEMVKGFVRLRSSSPTVAIPISICNITYSSPFGESIALNKLAKEGLEILAQTLAGKGIYRRQTPAMHPGKLSQSKEIYR